MNYSRKFFPILAAAVLLVFTSFQFQVNSFLAVYQGSDIRLEWKVTDETEVLGYEISRKKDSDAGYSRLTELPKSNAGNYFWVDDNLYKDGEGIENISYRLTANTSTGPKYFYAGIQHSPTAIQRSWGSIKSMFR
jgi:hypothetical protein